MEAAVFELDQSRAANTNTTQTGRSVSFIMKNSELFGLEHLSFNPNFFYGCYRFYTSEQRFLLLFSWIFNIMLFQAVLRHYIGKKHRVLDRFVKEHLPRSRKKICRGFTSY